MFESAHMVKESQRVEGMLEKEFQLAHLFNAALFLTSPTCFASTGVFTCLFAMYTMIGASFNFRPLSPLPLPPNHIRHFSQPNPLKISL